MKDSAGPSRGRRSFIAVTAIACLVFVAYAGCFLHFFVDDEAIPLVYARNLLRGRGLIYTVLEGRSEGYSDFLHVLWSTLLLQVTRTLDLSPLAPLLIGKAVSLAAGVGVIAVTARILRRESVALPGLAAGLAFLALAGPLAVWSCSSLETVPFALAVLAFFGTLLAGRAWLAVTLGITCVLLRIDGVVYVFTVMLAVAVAEPRRRRDARAVAQLVALAALAFHTWRYVYFGSLLSAPLSAKVLYHVAGPRNAMLKAPDVSYLVAFLRLYGLWAAGVLAVAAAIVARRSPAARAATVALVILGPYVQLVSDWMFGWRFVVALLPFAAIPIATAIGRAPRRIAWIAAALTIVWCGAAASAFANTYVSSEEKPLFWAVPRAGQAAWLGRYYDAVTVGRGLIHPGDRIAYNQAGLLPYLLDVENIDDLGICSGFVARLPTTDVYYTGVGRYSPLTDQPVLRTVQAYLLYQDVQFVIAPLDLLVRANHDAVPDAILDDYFTRVPSNALQQNVIYRRSAKLAGDYRHDSTLFAENLAHTSRLLRADIGGRQIDSDRLGPELPMFRELKTARTFTGDLRIDLGFARRNEDAYAFYASAITSKVPLTLTLSLSDEQGRETLRKVYALEAGTRGIFDRFPAAVPAVAMTLDFDVPGAADTIRIADVRLEGQSAALKAYLSRNLQFQ